MDDEISTSCILSGTATLANVTTDLRAGIVVGFSAGPRAISCHHNPDELWDPPSPLLNGHQGLFPELKLRNVKLTNILHHVPRLRISGSSPSLQHTPLWPADGLYWRVVWPCIFIMDGAVQRHHPHRTHDPRSGSQDHHPSKNSVQKTTCCNLSSNAPDDGRMYTKHVELRIHQ